MELSLSGGGRVALIDDEDFALVSAIRWCAADHDHSCGSEVEAARAYNALALEAFGEFATLNDIPPVEPSNS
jgi:hypothetical protein